MDPVAQSSGGQTAWNSAVLAANAKPAQRDDNCREETDGMIHQTYV